MCACFRARRRIKMNQCPKCSNAFLKDDAVFCPSCGSMTGNRIPREMLPDKPNSAVAFLAFVFASLFPKGVLFGFTLWAAKTDITPKAARTYGLCAVIPWIVKWILKTITTVINVILLIGMIIVVVAVIAILCYYNIIPLSSLLSLLPF